MLNILFSETANNLRSFFQNVLPDIDADRWKKYVVSALSFQQQQRVEENKINNLSGLDLAALLRVLDKNWYEIPEKAALPRQVRHWAEKKIR